LATFGTVPLSDAVPDLAAAAVATVSALLVAAGVKVTLQLEFTIAEKVKYFVIATTASIVNLGLLWSEILV